MELIAEGDYQHAKAPLEEIARKEPEKSSVREALGRVYFRTHDYRGAVGEFEAVVSS
jgi:Flp pilus assembly protein TadD